MKDRTEEFKQRLFSLMQEFYIEMELREEPKHGYVVGVNFTSEVPDNYFVNLELSGYENGE